MGRSRVSAYPKPLLPVSAHTCAVAHFYTFFCHGKKGFGWICMFLQELGGGGKWRVMEGLLLPLSLELCNV